MPRLKWSMVKTMRDAERMARDSRIAIFSKVTPWWSFNPADALKHPMTGVACDPRGSDLLELKDPVRWLALARDAAERGRYGDFGLRAFMAAYHGNVVLVASDVPHDPEKTGMPTCLATWDEYGALLEEAGERPQRSLQTIYVLEVVDDERSIRRARQDGRGQHAHEIAFREDLAMMRDARGFGWGHIDADCAMSAVSILADFLGDDEEAQRRALGFMWDFIGPHEEDLWSITGQEIVAWHAGQR